MGEGATLKFCLWKLTDYDLPFALLKKKIKQKSHVVCTLKPQEPEQVLRWAGRLSSIERNKKEVSHANRIHTETLGSDMSAQT